MRGLPFPVIIGVFVVMMLVLFFHNRRQPPSPTVEPATLTPEERELGVQAVLDLPLSGRQRHRLRPDDLTFSPDGRFIAGSSSRGPHVWDPRDGSRIGPSGRTYLLWGGNSVRALAYSPDSRNLAAAVEDQYRGYLMIWDTDAGARHQTETIEETGFEALAYAFDGRTLAWLSARALGVWDPGSGEVIQVEKESVAGMGWVRDGNGIESIVTIVDLRIEHHNPRTLRVTQTVDLDIDTYFVSFLAGGSHMIHAYRDRVELRDSLTGTLVAAAEGFSPEIECACAPPDLAWIALGTDTGRIEIWHPGDDGPAASAPAHAGRVNSIACSSLGQLVSSDDEGGKVWNASLLETMWPVRPEAP